MIFVITHKIFDDSILNNLSYCVLHVGQNDNFKKYYLRDDVGDNISCLNISFCELTGIYWLWKNYKQDLDESFCIVHYRRYFTTYFCDFLYTYFGINPSIRSSSFYEKYLDNFDIILPKRVKIFRTVQEFYSDLHCKEDLFLTRKVLCDLFPEYTLSFDEVMNSHYFYYANMMVCRRKVFNDYCQWLFSIMNELKKLIDVQKYDNPYQQRVFGFISERLLQVWVLHNSLKVKECSVFNTESKRINIFKKNSNRLKKILSKTINYFIQQ